MKLLIAGGGTGGHVFPALEIAREWLCRAGNGGAKREVVVVGTQRGLEMKLVPKAGLPLETIRAAGLKGIGGARLLNNAAMLLPACWDSGAVLRRHKFVAALGVGGYASGPMMLAAILRGIPTVVFEPNIEPGLANRILARMATRVATAFPETAQRWPSKSVVTGCPIRREFFAAPVRPHQPPFRLLITGGSQGALPINRTVIDSLDRLAQRKNQLFIVHQTGERDYNAVRVAYARRELNAEVLPFIENMADQFAQSDLIVCRSGAITVAEVAAAGRAAIFVPFGSATDNHQLRNALGLQQIDAGRVIPQHELTPDRLTSEIFAFLDQPQRICEVEEHVRALARPRAAHDIVDLLEGIARP